MRPAEDIKRLIKKLNDKTSAKMDERVLNDVLYALEDSKNTSALSQPNTRRIFMKTKSTTWKVRFEIVVVQDSFLYF